MPTARRRLLLAWLPACLMGAGAPSVPGVSDPLAPILPLLDQRAAMYQKAALGFSAEETVIQGKFSPRSGENKREEKTRYDYLYEGNPDAGYREVRMLPDRGGDPQDTHPVNPELDVPGAYDWALLFTPQHRPFFRFDLAGQELVGFHVSQIIEFRGAKVFEQGRDIREWEGKVWVDRETGNFVKVEATPVGQDDLLRVRTLEWMKAMRIIGIPTKRQPRGYRYRLVFSIDRFGLSFPGEAVTYRFFLTPQGEEEIRERIAQKFRNYVFFNVRSGEDFRGTEPATPRR